MVSLARARAIALSMPEAEERAHHGIPDFRIRGRIFATLRPEDGRSVVKLAPADQAALVQMHPEAFALTGWSQQGWLGVNLRKLTEPQYRELVESAWRNVAPRSLVAGDVPKTSRGKIQVRPLTPERWPDLEAVFNAKGCSVARRCWCMYYRRSGSRGTTPGWSMDARANRAALKQLVGAGRPPGLIGYRGKTPVGWVSLGPREDYARLERSPVMKAVDDRPVWSVICFVVPSEYRGQGVARALLDGAIVYAKKQGATLIEAYPVDRAARSGDEAMWFGARSMYDRAGFHEVARRKPERPIVRLETGSRR